MRNPKRSARQGTPSIPLASLTGVPQAAQGEEDLLWIRGDFIASPADFGKKVIFGHTPFRQPLVMPNKIGIDTGAAYGNCLTCLKLPQKEFLSVSGMNSCLKAKPASSGLPAIIPDYCKSSIIGPKAALVIGVRRTARPSLKTSGILYVAAICPRSLMAPAAFK